MIEVYVRNGNKEASIKTVTLSAKQIEVIIRQIFDVLMSRTDEKAKPVSFNQQFTVQKEMTKEPHYKLRLECPECGTRKNLYQPMGIEKIQCELCKTFVRVEPATEKGYGSTEEHRDEWGNFMIAKRHYSRPRQLPKVGSESRSTFPIAELIGGKLNDSEGEGN